MHHFLFQENLVFILTTANKALTQFFCCCKMGVQKWGFVGKSYFDVPLLSSFQFRHVHLTSILQSDKVTDDVIEPPSSGPHLFPSVIIVSTPPHVNICVDSRRPPNNLPTRHVECLKSNLG